MKEGDINSKCSHVKASNRWCKNWLTYLINVAVVRLDGEIMETHVVDYFRTLFIANLGNGPLESLLNIDSRIDEAMRDDLSREYTEDEMINALKRCTLLRLLTPWDATSLLPTTLAYCWSLYHKIYHVSP